MANESVMILGLKETFIIRVLVKKLKDAGMEAKFVPATLNDINKSWNENCLITYYMETHEQIAGEVLRFLSDKLRDTESQMLLIGEPDDTRHAADNLPGDFLYKIFPRPLDNDLYVKPFRIC